MIVVSRYTVGFINHQRTVNGSPERLQSAARDQGTIHTAGLHRESTALGGSLESWHTTSRAVDTAAT